jgi:hypothetical protein
VVSGRLKDQKGFKGWMFEVRRSMLRPFTVYEFTVYCFLFDFRGSMLDKGRDFQVQAVIERRGEKLKPNIDQVLFLTQESGASLRSA